MLERFFAKKPDPIENTPVTDADAEQILKNAGALTADGEALLGQLKKQKEIAGAQQAEVEMLERVMQAAPKVDEVDEDLKAGLQIEAEELAAAAKARLQADPVIGGQDQVDANLPEHEPVDYGFKEVA